MLRILLSAHCFAKSEPSPKTLFYFSADHCSLVLQDIHIRQFYTLSHLFKYIIVSKPTDKTLVAGAWTERKKMYHGGSFLKLADDNMDIQNPEAQNRVFSGF